MILNIHLEYCDDKGKRLEKITKIGKPFNIIPIPILFQPENEVFRNGVYPSDYFYPEKITGLLKELSQEDCVNFGQQGLMHYCKDCFKQKEKKDPWHENVCLYKKSLSAEEQMKFMKEGKKILENNLKTSPTIYVAPNHQFDKNTKIAAQELGYKYFVTRGLINLSPYEEDNLIILPERELRENGEIFYTHYDEMKNNFEGYLELIKNSESLEKIELSKKQKIKVNLNDMLLIAKKRLRDLVKVIA